MHGIPVFRGTRVPVQTLFEYLEGGDTVENFLGGFPTVSRVVALEALEATGELTDEELDRWLESFPVRDLRLENRYR